jgi:hypothetical protein
MRPSELLLTNKHMDTPIIVLNPIHQPAQRVLLHPVNLKVPEGLSIPATDNGETVSASEVLHQKLLLDRPLAAFFPHGFNPGIVHPAMQHVEVGRCACAEMLLDAGD